MVAKCSRGRGPRAVTAAGGRKVEKLTPHQGKPRFSRSPRCPPEVPGRGAEGVRELLWAPRGVSRIHLRPSGHHFFSFRGIAGRADRIFGSDGPSKT